MPGRLVFTISWKWKPQQKYKFENWPGIKYLQGFGFHWMTLVFGKYSQYFQHPTCEDILRAGIKILGITTKLSDGSLCEQTISLVQNLKDPFCQTVQRMTICSIHYDIWWMICGWNPEKEPTDIHCSPERVVIFWRTGIKYQIFLVWSNPCFCPMTRWLVTEPILAEGGDEECCHKWRWENAGFRSNCSGLNWLDYAGFKKICTNSGTELGATKGPCWCKIRKSQTFRWIISTHPSDYLMDMTMPRKYL